MQTSTRSVAWREEDEGVVVEVVQLIAPPALDLGVEATLTYTVTACGVSLSASGRTYGDYHDIIPRIGITFEAPGTGREVTWLGLGPGENYPDSRAAAVVGRWTSTVEDMQTPYVVPQDCANRGGVRWFALTDSRGTGLAVARTPGGRRAPADRSSGRPRERTRGGESAGRLLLLGMAVDLSGHRRRAPSHRSHRARERHRQCQPPPARARLELLGL